MMKKVEWVPMHNYATYFLTSLTLAGERRVDCGWKAIKAQG